MPKYFEPAPDRAYDAPLEVKTVDQVDETPQQLPQGYDWDVIDLSDDAVAQELYELLTNHYVEDSDGKFRFDYSIPFLRWALNPPGNFDDWNIGVRANGKLYAFISAIPVTMVVNEEQVRMAEVNFLCVHK